MLAWLRAIPTALIVIKELVVISIKIYQMIRAEYERSQRARVVKEMKEAIKESVATGDNTRLVNIFNPISEPYPRKPKA